MEYDPVLVVCFEGLQETDHPYNFAARQSIKEMLVANGSYDKLIPILTKITNPLRNALSSDTADTFADTLGILQTVNNNITF